MPPRGSSSRSAGSWSASPVTVRGAKTLTDALYGVGPITGLALTCWLGGADRFSSARKAVRFAGLDVTVYSSAGKRSPGHLSRQGPPVLRWCLYEAGKTHALGQRARPRLLRARSRTASTANAPRCPRPARSSGTPATSSPISVRTPSSGCDLTVWSPQRLRNGAGSGATHQPMCQPRPAPSVRLSCPAHGPAAQGQRGRPEKNERSRLPRAGDTQSIIMSPVPQTAPWT